MNRFIKKNDKLKTSNKEAVPNKNTTYMELAYILKEAGVDIDIEECKRIDQIDQAYELDGQDTCYKESNPY